MKEMWINKNKFLDYPGTKEQREQIEKWEKEGHRFSLALYPDTQNPSFYEGGNPRELQEGDILVTFSRPSEQWTGRVILRPDGRTVGYFC